MTMEQMQNLLFEVQLDCPLSCSGPIYMDSGPRDNPPPPPSYPKHGNISLCHCKIQTTIYMNVPSGVVSGGGTTWVDKLSHLVR